MSFYRHLQSVHASSAPTPGSTRQTQAPWLFLDAAHTLFTLAKRRVYTGDLAEKEGADVEIPARLALKLEEQPKWSVLTEVLQEIELDISANLVPMGNSNGVTLIMCSGQETSRQIREYLQTMDEHLPEGEYDSDEKDQAESRPSAATLLRKKLRSYFFWKKGFKKASNVLFPDLTGAQQRGIDLQHRRAPPNKRRRVRGGGSVAVGPSRVSGGAIVISDDNPNQVAQLLQGIQPTEVEQHATEQISRDPMEDLDDYYELFDLQSLVVVHPYDGDNDEHLLEELRPRFVVMYDPDTAFIRRVEVKLFAIEDTDCWN